MLKKIISIFFIVLLLLNSAMMLCCYFSEMGIHKMEMKAYIASRKDFRSNLLTVFTAGDHFELVSNDEISSFGKMYDIVKTERHEGQTVYYAISDDKEDVLISDISKLVKKDTEGRPRQDRRITVQLSKFVSNYSYAVCSPTDLFTLQKTGYLHSHYLSPLSNILAPPPKQQLS